MSLIVFLIAALPAVGVVVVAEKTRNKGAVVVAALVAAALGALTGNAAYLGVDLLCVGIAVYISWNITKTPIYRTPQEIAAAQEKAHLERIKAAEAAAKRDKAIADFLQAAVGIVAISGFLLWKFWEPSVPRHAPPSAATQPQPQQAVVQPARAAVKPQSTQKTNSKQQSVNTQGTVRKTTPTKKHSVENCLQNPNEQAMVRCLENTQ